MFPYLQSVKLGIYYFLSTSLIIFPTGAAGAALGTAASIRYLRKRHVIGSFDAAAVSAETRSATPVFLIVLPFRAHAPEYGMMFWVGPAWLLAVRTSSRRLVVLGRPVYRPHDASFGAPPGA